MNNPIKIVVNPGNSIFEEKFELTITKDLVLHLGINEVIRQAVDLIYKRVKGERTRYTVELHRSKSEYDVYYIVSGRPFGSGNKFDPVYKRTIIYEGM